MFTFNAARKVQGTKDHERPGYMHIISILNYKSKLLIMLPRSCWPAIRKGTVFLSLVLFYFILLVYFFLSPPPPPPYPEARIAKRFIYAYTADWPKAHHEQSVDM